MGTHPYMMRTNQKRIYSLLSYVWWKTAYAYWSNEFSQCVKQKKVRNLF